VLGGAAKEEFQQLTMRLCSERLPADKAEATLTKLQRKAGKDWKNVSWWVACLLRGRARARAGRRCGLWLGSGVPCLHSLRSILCPSSWLPLFLDAVLLSRSEQQIHPPRPAPRSYIAICLRRHADAVPEWEEVAAVASAVQNMQLVASAVGVAGYWSSWQEAGEFRTLTRLFLAGRPQPHRTSPHHPSPPHPSSPHPKTPARTAPEMLEFLGMQPGDLCLGYFVAGVADAERAAGYKASRRPLEGVVKWRA
jgi:hypothetical protein